MNKPLNPTVFSKIPICEGFLEALRGNRQRGTVRTDVCAGGGVQTF